jgi:signal transduction histidine kinase
MKRKCFSFRTIVIRTIAITLSVWLLLMGLMTLHMAAYFRQHMILLTQTDEDYADYYEEYEEYHPGAIEYGIIWRRQGWAFSAPSFQLNELKEPYGSYSPSRNPFLKIQDTIRNTLDLPHFNEIAIINYDYNNQILMTSGNRLTFEYTSDESWLNQNAPYTEFLGHCWIDLDAIPGAVEAIRNYCGEDLYVTFNDLLQSARMTGWFEDDQFHPITMEFAYHEEEVCPFQQNGLTMEQIETMPAYDFEQWEDAHGLIPDYYHYVRFLDHLNDIQWNTVLSLPVPEDRELVTIYCDSPDGIITNPHLSVTVDGKTYETLNDLRLESDYTDGVIGNLWETIIFKTVTKKCFRSDDFYTYAMTVRCRPLQYALVELIPVYIQTALALGTAVALILRRIRKKLLLPIQHINAALAHPNALIEPTNTWKDPVILGKQFKTFHKTIAQAQAENTRLNTALDFATDADTRRKDMISNMARELKAPLAAIRNHSQTLQSSTTPENLDPNLHAVLEETDRMDSMVMQLLHISRMEAGRVKLNIDIFPLAPVIQSAAEACRPMLEEKSLELRIDLTGKQEMRGDSVQIEKVITQFIQNAATYTSPGGLIQINAHNGFYGTFFNVVNTHPHLSEEELHRAYDPFYRGDNPQAKNHAGLGLAIAKGILSLHGSIECYAQNTQLDYRDAVEFGFRPIM